MPTYDFGSGRPDPSSFPVGALDAHMASCIKYILVMKVRRAILSGASPAGT
jgi:hypothetical protein